MANASVMALLGHRTVQHDAIPGGISRLTAEDVAGALGMADISREAYLFGLLKYVGDKTVIHELDKLTQRAVILFGLKNKWRAPFADDDKRSMFFFLQLGRLVINELVGENICPTCNGTGVYIAKARKCSCSNGRRPPKKAILAKFCGMKPEAWKKTWHDRYTACVAEFYLWETEITSAISTKINFFQQTS
ncbi:hypothetical protein KCM76_23325 [Zooshikella marina]|uniref:hypothetical protein n=1 Tax=Zooshikella ganghwensis TaxID=202772 RepID=UPI001BAFC26E|nr:hypothetical protein [Zooshikella ganghwensis]MBU2708946.1 hypothetical protein [Zooshikella ganghwensis]